MTEPFLPASNNLSFAWREVFLKLHDRGSSDLTPVVVTVRDFDEHGLAREHPAIRQRLDTELIIKGKYRCHTVANTIFPHSLWNPAVQDDGKELFERYGRIWSSIAKCRGNSHGVYFRRLTAYAPKGHPGEPVNQLQHIIETYRGGNHRRSALQASLFDPTRDHTHSKQQGFPCLQQVAFMRIDRGLSITGFYPTQYQFERAYGNYLGLCRLGRFMAVQLGMPLVQMTCIASVAKLGDAGKAELQALADDLRQIATTIDQETY